eukprot:comp12510_c0_seq1/m.7481 comp12510_c0_seq1/g.7481  ORF comp12510_c0_seq1/g.7481 comp12510_c0_seq1/m.7481 type:complete len:512 (-) comp12510_c0_seq1:673-2208(-)
MPLPEYKYAQVTPAIVEELTAAIGGDSTRVKFAGNENDLEEIKKHSWDHSYHEPHDPEAVVYPNSTEDVKAIVALAAKHVIPLTTASARTGLEGGAIPMKGGIVMDMQNMNKILEVHKEDMQVTVQAGIYKKDMVKFAEENGYFFAVDPGSEATMGGYASTGASGTLSVKYGTMRENVIRLRVVMPDGRDMWTRVRSIKSSTGYDINRLFMGAEGTLGIVTEVTLKLFPKPAGIVASMAPFPDLHSCANAVIAIAAKMPTTLARCELLNKEAIGYVNSLFKSTHPINPTLFLEFHATFDAASAETDAKAVETLCKDHGAVSYSMTSDEKERDALWQARKGAYFASYKARTGGKIKLCVTDVCVPISKFADVVAETEKDFAENSKTNLPCPIVGHACDGNFHVMCAFDTTNKEQVDELKALEQRMVIRAIKAGGTASGEHGVGLGKRKYMVPEHGEVYVDYMEKIKAAVDPLGIMNPTKLFPTEAMHQALKSWDGPVSTILSEGQGGCGCDN